jgi:hypothetical protein
MLYLYLNNKGIYFVTNSIVSNLKYTLIRVFDITINNTEIVFSKLNTHVLNTCMVSSTYAYIIIINRNKNKLDVKIFEKYDILKDYNINLNSDLVFELYYVNGIFKGFQYPFHFNDYYIVCPKCKDISQTEIYCCNKCISYHCLECNIFNGEICENCVE